MFMLYMYAKQRCVLSTDARQAWNILQKPGKIMPASVASSATRAAVKMHEKYGAVDNMPSSGAKRGGTVYGHTITASGIERVVPRSTHE
jgi:hypothetical protein